MAVLGDAIYARLTGHSGTAALVGDRVYPLQSPQGTGSAAVPYPAIVYQVFEDAPTHLMGADLNERHAEVQVDCYGLDYDSAHAVAAQVRSALSRWNGTAGGVVVLHVFLEAATDMAEPTYEGEGETGAWRVMLQFTAHWQD